MMRKVFSSSHKEGKMIMVMMMKTEKIFKNSSKLKHHCICEKRVVMIIEGQKLFRNDKKKRNWFHAVLGENKLKSKKTKIKIF